MKKSEHHISLQDAVTISFTPSTIQYSVLANRIGFCLLAPTSHSYPTYVPTHLPSVVFPLLNDHHHHPTNTAVTPLLHTKLPPNTTA